MSCIISFLYIKPQLSVKKLDIRPSCIISFLYIKPQPSEYGPQTYRVVLYRFSTSNHNLYTFIMFVFLLYYIVSLHQTTTSNVEYSADYWLYYIVSLHQTTTDLFGITMTSGLYYIVSLHQTTTALHTLQTI